VIIKTVCKLENKFFLRRNNESTDVHVLLKPKKILFEQKKKL